MVRPELLIRAELAVRAPAKPRFRWPIGTIRHSFAPGARRSHRPRKQCRDWRRYALRREALIYDNLLRTAKALKIIIPPTATEIS